MREWNLSDPPCTQVGTHEDLKSTMEEIEICLGDSPFMPSSSPRFHLSLKKCKHKQGKVNSSYPGCFLSIIRAVRTPLEAHFSPEHDRQSDVQWRGLPITAGTVRHPIQPVFLSVCVCVCPYLEHPDHVLMLELLT